MLHVYRYRVYHVSGYLLHCALIQEGVVGWLEQQYVVAHYWQFHPWGIPLCFINRCNIIRKIFKTIKLLIVSAS